MRLSPCTTSSMILEALPAALVATHSYMPASSVLTLLMRTAPLLSNWTLFSCCSLSLQRSVVLVRCAIHQVTIEASARVELTGLSSCDSLKQRSERCDSLQRLPVAEPGDGGRRDAGRFARDLHRVVHDHDVVVLIVHD